MSRHAICTRPSGRRINSALRFPPSAALLPHFSFFSPSLPPPTPFQTNLTLKFPNWRKASAAAALHATAFFSLRRCCSSPPSFCPSDRGGGGDTSRTAGPAPPPLTSLAPHPRPKGFASEDRRPITATIKRTRTRILSSGLNSTFLCFVLFFLRRGLFCCHISTRGVLTLCVL